MSALFLAYGSVMDNPFASGMLGGGIVALILGAVATTLLVGVIVWIYQAFAYMAIAKKARQKSPELAWIPIVGPLIIAFKASKMHWWPWLLLIGLIVPAIGWIAILVFAVYAVIWNWKLFEAVHKPGWWAILLIIPIVNLVMIGIVAWSKR